MENNDLKTMFRENKVSFAYLFGSQASGSSGEKSDVDIAVMLPLEMKKKRDLAYGLILWAQFQKFLKKKWMSFY